MIEQAALFCLSNEEPGNSIEISFLINGYIVIRPDEDDKVIEKILSYPDGSIQNLELKKDFYETIQSDDRGYLCICNALPNKLAPEILFKKSDDITGQEFFTSSYMFSKLVPSEEPEFA